MVNKSKKNFILIFLGLALSEILLSIFGISVSYGDMFKSGNIANIFLAIFEVVFIYGLFPACINWLISYIYYAIVRRYAVEFEGGMFVRTVMLYTMFANLISAVIFAFNFLDERMFVFVEYLCPIVINGILFGIMTHITLLKNVSKKAEVFLSLSLPYLVWKVVGYLSNVMLYFTYNANKAIYDQLGLIITFDKNQKLAMILGAVAIVLFSIYIGVAYALIKKNGDTPHVDNNKNSDGSIDGEVEEPKVFDDFDI